LPRTEKIFGLTGKWTGTEDRDCILDQRLCFWSVRI
jgi:hypothetical protein